MGTDRHSTSVDQGQLDLVSPCARIGCSSAIACFVSNAAAFLLGNLFLTAYQNGTVFNKNSDFPRYFLFAFLKAHHYMLWAVILVTPYMHARTLGRSGSASWNSKTRRSVPSWPVSATPSDSESCIGKLARSCREQNLRCIL